MKKKADWRYRIAHKEALIGIGLALFHFAWWFSFAYGLGSKPVSEYTYILGFPAWFFYSCILGIPLIILLVWIIVRFFFSDLPLEDEERGESE